MGCIVVSKVGIQAGFLGGLVIICGWWGTGGCRVGVLVALLKVGVIGAVFEVGGWWGIRRG